MGEMSEDDIQKRFDELVETLGGNQKPVAEMETASELLDEHQRILGEHRKLAAFLLDLKNSERDLRLEVQQLSHEAKEASLKIQVATLSKDRAQLEQLRDSTADFQGRHDAAVARLDQLNAHQRRIMEFNAEILKVEVAIQNRRRELSL